MINSVYTWMRQIAYYMVLVTAVMQVAAAQSYRKYIRLFTGIILVLMILAPVMQLFEMNEKETWVFGTEYETIVQDVEEKVKEMEQEMPPEPEEGLAAGNTEDSLTGTDGSAESEAEEKTNRIEVEEIRIGR